MSLQKLFQFEVVLVNSKVINNKFIRCKHTCHLVNHNCYFKPLFFLYSVPKWLFISLGSEKFVFSIFIPTFLDYLGINWISWLILVGKAAQNWANVSNIGNLKLFCGYVCVLNKMLDISLIWSIPAIRKIFVSPTTIIK